MQRFILSAMAAACVLTATASAQEKQEKSVDDVSRQTTQLEAELGRYRDASPEAAETMLKLLELYYDDARLFGVVRIGRKFVTAQPTHERHKEVMLKLIDALEATARYTDMAATCRQFIGHYGDAPECLGVDRRLGIILDQTGKPGEAAEAYAAGWRRSPEKGRFLGSAAVRRYAALNTPQGRISAATLAEEMFDKSSGAFAEHVAWQAFYQWRAASDWAKANLVASKMLKAKMPSDKHQLRELHSMMAEHYTNLSQHGNAVRSLQQARSLADSRALHVRHIQAMYNNVETKPAEIEAVANQYAQKYPEASDRYALLSNVPQVYLRSGDKAKALQLIAGLLPHDAATHNQAAVYVQQNGDEPEQLAQSEKVLLAAINENTLHAAQLRYVLGFELYRDRLKDEAKARQVLRDLATKSPEDSHFSQQAISWLLNNASSDAEFNSNVALLAKTRADNLHRSGYVGRLGEWANQAAETAKSNKDNVLQQRVARVRAELAKTNDDAVVQGWFKSNYGGTMDAAASAYRYGLIGSKQVDKLPERMAWSILYHEGYWARHHSPANLRPRSAEVFDLLRQRFPEDSTAAYWFVETAYHYGPAEQAHEAVRHMLKAVPTSSDSQAWYYTILAADRSLSKEDDPEEVKEANLAKNKELVGQVLAWIVKSQQQAEMINPTYATYIGDTAAKYGLEDESLAYWKLATTYPDSDHTEVVGSHLRIAGRMEGKAKIDYLQQQFAASRTKPGEYVRSMAHNYLLAGDYANFEKVLRQLIPLQRERAIQGAGFDEATVNSWTSTFGVVAKEGEEPREVTEEQKRQVLAVVSDLRVRQSSALAELSLLAMTPPDSLPAMERVLRYHRAAQLSSNAAHYWDQFMPHAQAALARKDYLAAATLVTGLLSNITSIDENRRKSGRDMVAQSYSRIGTVGLTIDDQSPIAPLLQATLLLRLGDDRLAFEAYTANIKLFDEHRSELPVDFLLFVCDKHSAAGGEENFNRVEDILRGWIVQYSESPQFDDDTKARVQLQLARNFVQARRYDIARSEFTTVKNRYAESAEALEAEFGIGETFMAQKVYDQAEAVFDKLANSQNRDVVIRAEFMRGVLAHRRGDREEARKIFQAVLDRVPDVDLANHSLFNLAEVYGAEERFADQLNLLRTVGRLGRDSKRRHKPGTDLSIVVQDSDLGISRGSNRVPVIVRTEPGGDEELIYLTSGGAGKGLFRADLRTELGKVKKGDRVLQLSGNDVIKCDYPDEFKAEFRQVPLSDVEIRVAADAEFEVASSLIVDKEEETFSQRLQRETEQEQDLRVSQGRPPNQIKPGNLLYLRVKDADRSLTDEPDTVVVKLAAQSGDEVQVNLTETGPYTGVFTGTAQTGELPAGALATDSAIGHSPLMAIDHDRDSYWLSEPNGAVPKSLSIDMKDLKLVSRVRISTPDPDNQAPVRGELLGSNDGEFWFVLASNPPRQPVEPAAAEFGEMTRRVYAGNFTSYDNWGQVVNLGKNSEPIEEEATTDLSWSMPEGEEEADKPYGVLWHGKFIQPRDGAVRFSVAGARTAVAVGDQLELPVGPGGRSVDVYLRAGAHDLTIFAATGAATQPVAATRARATLSASSVQLLPFRAEDFDLDEPLANVSPTVEPASVLTADGDWEFRFEPIDVRHIRFVVQEYLGEAVAISNVDIRGEEDDQRYIPTEEDVLALAHNDVLEIAAGDVITATYVDEETQSESGGSRVLTQSLTATFFDGRVATIDYDLVRNANGTVSTVRKDLMRIDPGDRFIVEIVDYDRDETDQRDTVTFHVMVNDGEPVELTATETEPYSGIFTKEVDTSPNQETDKLQVKSGDRIYCRYIDTQNTFPGHSVPRETTLYVREPTQGIVRVMETRFTPADKEAKTPARTSFLPPDPAQETSSVALEVPLTVEVIDRDAAKDSRSTVDVTLTTPEGVKVDVTCVVSGAFASSSYANYAAFASSQANAARAALEEGRFVGQVILQLGGKNSPDVMPLSADMPRNLVGGPKLEEEQRTSPDQTLVTRVLNVTGKDVITATYRDELRPDGKPLDLEARGRLVTNGQLLCTDRNYEKPVTQLHVGEKLFLMVIDPDQDTTDDRDTVEVEITTENGEREVVLLEETLAHSGIFTASLTLKASDSPTSGNLDPEDPEIETYFGDIIRVKYVDKAASVESGVLELELEIPVVIGTDGLVSAFSKTFNNEQLAVETKFHIAEAYFELFKSHKSLGRESEEKTDLEAGRRVLREVMEDYPDPKYVPRVAYLLGQFSQELEHWNEAIDSYELIVRQHSDHSLAADAQYKMAQCYEQAGDFEQALEAYVTLAATYPKSPLIANVMIRISDYFYKKENYEVAAQVGEKFLERFDGHQHAARIAFRVGQSYYKAKLYAKASGAFDKFVKVFPDDQLCSDALFWSGESFRMANNNSEAFRRYNRCRWDFPASEAAKYARGRLTLPEMLQQFEQEALSLENQ